MSGIRKIKSKNFFILIPSTKIVFSCFDVRDNLGNWGEMWTNSRGHKLWINQLIKASFILFAYLFTSQNLQPSPGYRSSKKKFSYLPHIH